MITSPLAGICTGSLAIIFVVIAFAFIKGSKGLRSYIVTRVLLTIPQVLILVSLIFFVMRIIPGDPVTSQLGPRGGQEARDRMTAQLGLDQPLLVQYGRYLSDIVRLDLGESLIFGNRPIVDELSERLPATVELVVPAMVLSIIAGIYIGTFAAKNRKKPVDYTLRVLSIVAYSIPVFWLGLMLQVLFTNWLPILPVAGRIDPVIGTSLNRVTNIYSLDALISGNWPAFLDTIKHLILPTIALTAVLIGTFIRLSRINVIESLVDDYILAARARGIREKALVYTHALGNALIPLVTMIGLQFSILIAGAVLTETTFSWPGMGQYLVERIGQRDYTAVQGVIIIFALSVALISLLTDIVYAFLDPRVRY